MYPGLWSPTWNHVGEAAGWSRPLVACAVGAESGAQAIPGAGGLLPVLVDEGAPCGARRKEGIEDHGRKHLQPST